MAGDRKPTVDDALRELDNWLAEHRRVTGLLLAEVEQAKGPTTHDEPPADRAR